MMRDFILQTARDYRLDSIPLLREDLREKLEARFKPGGRSNLIKQMEVVIEKMKTGEIVTPSKKKYSPGTLKGMRHTVRILEKFGLRSATLKTYNDFISWGHVQNYSTNYIGGQIKNWKTLGKAADKNPIYDQFKIITEETYDIYLSEQELKAMYDLKLNNRECVTRDWFILDSYTGLRISDIQLLTQKNIQSGFITIANEKTDEVVKIPVHPFVRNILKKYKGFPPKVSDQEINRTIKKVAQKAKINSNVLYTITKGGVREDNYLKKWQMVSCHTCRRSFITNLLKAGVSETLVMKLTGIKSHVTMQRYNKMSIDEAAKIMSKHKFFK